jgi:hypothetical protein
MGLHDRIMFVLGFNVGYGIDAISRELRSVTIWFQNKRQTERKLASALSTGSENSPPQDRTCKSRRPFPSHSQGKGPKAAMLPSRHMCRTLSTPALPPSLSRDRTMPLGRSASLNMEMIVSSEASGSSVSSYRRSSLPSTLESACENALRVNAKLSHKPTLSRRPTLENVLERGRTSSRNSQESSSSRRSTSMIQTTPTSSRIYDAMLSSPVELSPQRLPKLLPDVSRSLIESRRGQKRTTLEWACAAAMQNGRQHEERSRSQRTKKPRHHIELPEQSGDETETDVDEVPTPQQSFVNSSPSNAICLSEPPATPTSISERIGSPTYVTGAQIRTVEPQKDNQDEDTMRAALALCGLGAGR